MQDHRQYKFKLNVEIYYLCPKIWHTFVDNATKFEILATQNCGHSTLMVLNSDWSSLGCLFSVVA
jgi:hypothetical protein